MKRLNNHIKDNPYAKVSVPLRGIGDETLSDEQNLSVF